jgi:hypothetical protein
MSDSTDKQNGPPALADAPCSARHCIHCGQTTTEEEGCVCHTCYSQYTPAMLADLE